MKKIIILIPILLLQLCIVADDFVDDIYYLPSSSADAALKDKDAVANYENNITEFNFNSEGTDNAQNDSIRSAK